MSKIEANLLSTKNIFTEPNDVKFIIPSFQRRFAWTRDNVKDMFNDFYVDSNNYSFESTSELDGYLLGSIVLIDLDNKSSYEVVDGQQRLITLSLIYKCIANRYKLMLENKENLDVDTMECLIKAQSFYYSKELENKKVRINQETKLSYYELYNKIVNDEYYEEDLKSISKDKNMCDVWEEINNQIDDFNDERLNKLFYYLQENVKLIKIVSSSEDRAFQLFEVLNNRGQSLQPLDLIKNMLLQKVSGEENITKFDKNWKNFSENLLIRKNGRGTSKDYSSTFLRYFIMSQYAKNVRKNELVLYFKNEIMDGHINRKNVIDFVENLSKYSNMFNKIVSKYNSNEFSSSPYMYALSHLDINQFQQLLMVFYFTNKNNQHELQEVREKVILNCIRMGLSNLYSEDLPNQIEKIMPILIRTFNNHFDLTDDINRSSEEMFRKMDEYNRSRLPSVKSLLSLDKLSNKKAINLLKLIELLINKNHNVLVKQPKGGKITLEHIMPQNKPDNIRRLGFNIEDDYPSIINSIGNLTLLTESENSSLKDQNFEIKRNAYSKSVFSITKAIGGAFEVIAKSGETAERVETLKNKYELSYEEWTKSNIKKRGEELTNLISDFIMGKI